jgi:hypothetical protein
MIKWYDGLNNAASRSALKPSGHQNKKKTKKKSVVNSISENSGEREKNRTSISNRRVGNCELRGELPCQFAPLPPVKHFEQKRPPKSTCFRMPTLVACPNSHQEVYRADGQGCVGQPDTGECCNKKKKKKIK